jgi:hypothetical protein
MFLEEAHQEDHGGVDNMVLRSRKKVWIVKARRMAKYEVKSKTNRTDQIKQKQ